MLLRKSLLFYIILFGCAINIHAQQLEGIVKNNSGETMPGVNIYIPELHKGTVTDNSGYFSLSALQAGNFKVQFSFIGYKTIVKQITISDQNIALDINMQPTVVEATEIIVSAPYMTTQEENPVQVLQMNKEALLKTGGTTLMDKVATLPGVSQISTGVGISKPMIRGLSFNRVVVFSQGVRIENQQWGAEHGLGLNEIGIEKVEVIKGPSSLLYGSDAMGGVIHLIDERPAKLNTIEGNYNLNLYSNTLGYATDLGFKGATDHFRFGLTGGYASHIDYETGSGERVFNSRFNEQIIKGNIGYSKGVFISNLNATWIKSNVGIPEFMGSESTSREIHEPNQLLNTYLVSSQNTLLLGNSKLKVNAGYLLNNRQEFEEEGAHGGHGHGHGEEEAALDMHLSTFNWDVKWYAPAGKKTELILGVQGMRQHNENHGEEVLIPDANVTDAGVLALLKFNLQKLIIQTGLRYDIRNIVSDEVHEPEELEYIPAMERSYNSLNGSIGGTYKVSESVLFRANVATGFRAPNLSELTSNGVHHGSNRYEKGNMDLLREQNIEGDLGMQFNSDHVSFDVAGFYNYIDNYIFLMPVDSFIDDERLYTYMQEDATLKGFESVLDIHPHPLDWLHLENIYSMVIGNRNNGQPLPLIPAHRLINDIRGEFKKAGFVNEPFFKIELDHHFPQKRTSFDETSTDGYTLFNASIGGKIAAGKQEIFISLNGNNLLNKKYISHLSVLKDDEIYNIGRNIVLNIQVPFSGSLKK